MSPLRYRDDDSSTTTTVLGVLAGAVAGFAVGMFVAQKMGGLDGIKARLRRHMPASGGDLESRFTRAHGVEDEGDGFDDIVEDELETEEVDETMEERVLDAFRNDPVLSGRAIDIGSISEGVIELAGWVESEDESELAVTVARGVPGVTTVVNRIVLGDEERRFEEAAARRFEAGDAPVADAGWDGQRVGTGRRRQGNSSEVDRHADPKVELGERWLREDAALGNAADDTAGLAERRRAAKQAAPRGDRAGGSAVSPSGVPKADHVSDPLDSGGA